MKMNFFIVMLTFVFLAFLIDSCKKDEICNVSVEGVLTDSLTGKPVSGIRLLLYSNRITTPPSLNGTDRLDETTSDINGKYFLKGTVDCHIILSDHPVVFHNGSPTYLGSGEPPVRLNNGENTVDFKLKMR